MTFRKRRNRAEILSSDFFESRLIFWAPQPSLLSHSNEKPGKFYAQTNLSGDFCPYYTPRRYERTFYLHF